MDQYLKDDFFKIYKERSRLKAFIATYNTSADFHDLPIFHNCEGHYLFWMIENDNPKWYLFDANRNVELGYINSE